MVESAIMRFKRFKEKIQSKGEKNYVNQKRNN